MIQVKNLTKYYGSFLAVDNLDFEIPNGQILGLLGPNGAGKSTTLRIMTGYLQPSSGTILLDNYDVRENPQQIKQSLGYLPESAPIYTDMMVYDYLDYIAEIRGLKTEHKVKRLKDLSNLCGIREVMHKPVSNLSKGYRQRVGLALALMSDPPLLILDEPTSGLDPNQIAEIRNIIREIGREKTVVFSTHILSEAEATCDRVLIVNSGKIVADGTADSLKASLAAETTLSLVLKGPKLQDLKSKIGQVNGVLSVETTKQSGKVIADIKCSEDLRENIYNIIKGEDWTLLEMVQQKQSLEKIFHELTRENVQ